MNVRTEAAPERAECPSSCDLAPPYVKMPDDHRSPDLNDKR